MITSEFSHWFSAVFCKTSGESCPKCWLGPFVSLQGGEVCYERVHVQCNFVAKNQGFGAERWFYEVGNDGNDVNDDIWFGDQAVPGSTLETVASNRVWFSHFHQEDILVDDLPTSWLLFQDWVKPQSQDLGQFGEHLYSSRLHSDLGWDTKKYDQSPGKKTGCSGWSIRVGVAGKNVLMPSKWSDSTSLMGSSKKKRYPLWQCSKGTTGKCNVSRYYFLLEKKEYFNTNGISRCVSLKKDVAMDVAMREARGLRCLRSLLRSIWRSNVNVLPPAAVSYQWSLGSSGLWVTHDDCLMNFLMTYGVLV